MNYFTLTSAKRSVNDHHYNVDSKVGHDFFSYFFMLFFYKIVAVILYILTYKYRHNYTYALAKLSV